MWSAPSARFNPERWLCLEPNLPTLASTDCLILVLYLFSLVAIGLSMRSNIKNSKDYFQAGRALPDWICMVAFISASLGAEEVIGMGAAGAGHGFRAALCFLFGGLPALLFVGLFMMPLYYGSGARSLPEYLGMRFDSKTRLLAACLFLAMTVASAGISLFMMAHLFQALHVFDTLFFAYGLPREGIFTVCVLLATIPVLVYVLFAGLAGTMVSQVLQFLLLVAGFLPIAWMGLKNIGGWSGLSASFAALSAQGVVHTGSAMAAAVVAMLGFVLGTVRWTTDLRVLQMAMAAKNVASARRIPLYAAVVRLALPFLLILPGAIAIGLPTPQSTTVVRNENGAIYHEITIVPRAITEGRGLVPARMDAATNNPRLDAAGHAVLDYGMATPNLLTHFATTGLLGLGIAALLASLMSGLAASIAAVNTVFTCDVYQSTLRKTADDGHYLAVGRWTTVGGVLLSIGVAYAMTGLGGMSSDTAITAVLVMLPAVFSLLNAPQAATFLLGMFSRRCTGHGAFAGLVAGFAIALLHHGLTLPAGAQAGLHGGWIGVVHRYPGTLAQCCWTAILSSAANLTVAWVVSLSTPARPETEFKGLVHARRASR